MEDPLRIAPEHQLPTITSVDDLRDDLHSELASSEAISAVPEICRRYGADISGIRRQIKSANFADLVSGLKRLWSAAEGRVPPHCDRVCKQSGGFTISGQREAAVSLPLRRGLLLQTRLVSRALPPSFEGATKAQRKAQERGS